MNDHNTDEALYEKEDFLLFFPSSVDIIKGSDEDRRIGGMASTGSLDRQHEQVLQKGLDFTEFVNHGYYNDNHRQDTAAVVGVPELARFIAGKGWYTEGYLLKGMQRSDEIWTLAKSLSSTRRRLGFSIEGKVQRRDGHRIVKAIVRHVAITNSPVNTDCTWDILTKSFCNNPCDQECHGTCCDYGKALSAGYVRGEGGRVLVPESLESRAHVTTFRCPKCKKGFPTARGLDGHVATRHTGERITLNDPTEVRRMAKALTRSEAIAQVMRLRPNLAEGTAARIVDLVIEGRLQ